MDWIDGKKQTPFKLKQSSKDHSNRKLISECIKGEREALMKLKRSFSDPSNRLTNWRGEDCCQWIGVGCNAVTGRVVKLDLRARYWEDDHYDKQLSAIKVDSSLTERKHLEYLDLSGNSFSAIQIPDFFGLFNNLKYLNLSRAWFGGMIPLQLGNLTSLQVLDLGDPDSLSSSPLHAINLRWVSSLSSLQNLVMSSVNFSETSNVLHALSELPSLLRLTLIDCGIQNIHFDVAAVNSTFLSSVRFLDLKGNKIGSEIPKAIQSMTLLRGLDLSHQRHGELNGYKGLSNLSSLQHLAMNGADFSEAFDLMRVLSKIPSLLHLNLQGCEIGKIHFLNSTFFSSLQSLDLSSNRFVGPIPYTFHNMTSLRSLDLSNNEFNSTVPLLLISSKTLLELDLSRNEFDRVDGGLFSFLNKACYAKSLDFSYNKFGIHEILNHNTSLSKCVNGYHLESLSLGYNLIGGRIPNCLGMLTNLKYFDLASNSLLGSIPQSLGSLVKLESLDLSHNQLSGSIPEALGTMVALESLDFSHNQLNGSIPKSLLGFISLTNLDLRSNKLSGHVPESIGQLVNLKSVDISYNSLEGVFSERHLANLSSLYSISIAANHLKCNFKSDWIPPFSLSVLSMSSCVVGSRFPPWIQKQQGVQILDLSNSNISGDFPAWPTFGSLYYLDLSKNKISGNPLADIGNKHSELGTLLLGKNLISGSIPNLLCKLGGLQVLDLSENELSGEIPPCWNKMKYLFIINLSSNKLSGNIPNSFGQLSNLKRFHANKNKFQGEVPQALRNCTNLEVLDLGGNNFSGSIPTLIGNSLWWLRILRLRKNMLNGRIPLQMCNLKHLQILDLAENNLIGDIPVCFDNLSGMSSALSLDSGPLDDPLEFGDSDWSTTQWIRVGDSDGRSKVLTSWDSDWSIEKLPVVTKGLDLEYTKLQLKLLHNMDISSNKLTGVIPEGLCSLSRLGGLNLSNNQLSGKIPNRIGELKSLETLDLSNNKLFGPIPQNMSALNSLSHLNLSNNDLSGRIPEGNQLRTLTDPSIYAGNSKLCGDLLLKKCVQPPISSGHEEEDTKKEKIMFWFVVTTGYALGLWGVIGTLMFMKNWRIAYFRFAEDKKEWILAMIAIKVARMKQSMQRT